MPSKDNASQDFDMGNYRSPRERIRWFTIRNMSSETIPGFAITYNDIGLGDSFISQDVLDGQVVINVNKPDINAQGMQNPAVMWANGPTPIEPGEYGKGHQHWPAQILHNGSVDTLPNGFSCGPIADSWYIFSGGKAFTCQSHDVTRAIRGDATGIHTVWISPGSSGAQPFNAARGGGTVAAGAAVETNVVIGTNDEGIERLTNGFLVLTDGVWLVSVSGTVSSLVATEGDLLSIALKVGTETDGKLNPSRVETYLMGHRIQTIGTGASDDNPWYGGDAIFTAENIAFTGVLTLRKDDVILVENTSSSAITIGDFVFSVVSIGQEPRDPTGSLVYPSD